MKETDFNEAKESKEENIDVKELLFKYLIHWPWFVGAVIACLIAAWLWTRSCVGPRTTTWRPYVLWAPRRR